MEANNSILLHLPSLGTNVSRIVNYVESLPAESVTSMRRNVLDARRKLTYSLGHTSCDLRDQTHDALATLLQAMHAYAMNHTSPTLVYPLSSSRVPWVEKHYPTSMSRWVRGIFALLLDRPETYHSSGRPHGNRAKSHALNKHSVPDDILRGYL